MRLKYETCVMEIEMRGIGNSSNMRDTSSRISRKINQIVKNVQIVCVCVKNFYRKINCSELVILTSLPVPVLTTIPL